MRVQGGVWGWEQSTALGVLGQEGGDRITGRNALSTFLSPCSHPKSITTPQLRLNNIPIMKMGVREQEVGMGVWGWEHGDGSMGMRTWRYSGTTECILLFCLSYAVICFILIICYCELYLVLCLSYFSVLCFENFLNQTFIALLPALSKNSKCIWYVVVKKFSIVNTDILYLTIFTSCYILTKDKNEWTS